MSAQIIVNYAAPNGKPIRPLHGVNSGPMTKVFTYDARPLFREAGLPYARLHDVEYPYGSGEFVDIPCIFRNFDADENDPANYNFGLTDEYLAHCVEVGCEPFFRLGVSIEHAPVKRHIYPPKDFAKWARICEHIIRHYTEGWADGYTWKIDYWEIWNEPDGNGNMWLGTPEQFYEFYTIAARHLKGCFPHLKIGGSAFCRGIKPFMVGFMDYLAAQEEPVPLDFYSWHRYFADISMMTDEAKAVDELLASHGYTNTESVFNEWNYMIAWDADSQSESYRRMKNHIGAAHHAAVLAAMQQDTSISLACLFEADVVKEFCSLFNVADMCIGNHGRKARLAPTKAFYSFKAFNELYKMGNAVTADITGDGIYACAACGEGQQGLLAANYTDEPNEITVDLKGLSAGQLEVRIIDEDHFFEPIMNLAAPADTMTLTLPVKANTVLYIGSPIE